MECGKFHRRIGCSAAGSGNFYEYGAPAQLPFNRDAATTHPCKTKTKRGYNLIDVSNCADATQLRSFLGENFNNAHEKHDLRSISLLVPHESGESVLRKYSRATQRRRIVNGYNSCGQINATDNEDSAECEVLHCHAHANSLLAREPVLRRGFFASADTPPSRERESFASLQSDSAYALNSSSNFCHRLSPCPACVRSSSCPNIETAFSLPSHCSSTIGSRFLPTSSTIRSSDSSKILFDPCSSIHPLFASQNPPSRPNCTTFPTGDSFPAFHHLGFSPEEFCDASSSALCTPSSWAIQHLHSSLPSTLLAVNWRSCSAKISVFSSICLLLLVYLSISAKLLLSINQSFLKKLSAAARFSVNFIASLKWRGSSREPLQHKFCNSGIENLQESNFWNYSSSIPQGSFPNPSATPSPDSPRTRMRSKPTIFLAFFVFCSLVCTSAGNSPPRFVVEGGNEIVVNLREGPSTPVGTVIAQLRASDPDGDDLSFGVQGEDAAALLNVEKTGPDTATVSLKSLLDREERGEYTLVLTVTDGRLGEGTFVTQSLLLLVEDVNDNEPVFLPYEAALLVEENSPPRVLASLRAMDNDEGPYGQVVYALAGDRGDAGAFSVSTVGGEAVLRLTGALDYETQNIYQLKVLARDRAPGGRMNTGTAAVVVRVQDVEDQPPEFVHAPPVTRIPEDIAVNAGVLQVKAVDGDKGVDNRIKYSILGGDDGFFGLDSDSGVLYVAKPLDRERHGATGETFFIQILAEEVSSVVSPPPTTTTEVTVLLQDVNDQTPRFRASHYVAEVTEAAQFNMPVNFIGDAIPEVYDNDQGINGTFRLTVEGAGGAFDVTPHEGINLASFLVRVSNPALIDYEKVQVMNVTLVAREVVAHNPKSSSCLVSVYVRDTNDNVPDFDRDLYEAHVPEDTSGGTAVALIAATDVDSGDFGAGGLRYTDIRGAYSQRLSLDPHTGHVALKEGAALDREEVNDFFVTVEVRDDRGRGNRNTVGLHIVVEDVNDNAPTFSQRSYEVKVDENLPQFLEPVVVVARDDDLNGTANHEVRYVIIAGDPLGNFSLDDARGELRLTAPLDYERMKPSGALRFFNLTVKAYDLGAPPLSSTCHVIVHVADVNDHSPEYEQDTYATSVPEDTPGGTTVMHVQAFDGDGSSLFSQVVYRIQHGAEDKFVIDAETGAILVARGAILDPDRTQPRTTEYVLEVVALDGGIGESQRRTLTLVNISIIDVNNKPPVFLDPGTVSVSESVRPGNFIAKVTASDADEDDELRYLLDEGGSLARNEEGALVKASDYDYASAFEIGEMDGVIRLVRALDREKVETIRLVVLCEDLNTQQGPRSASATLTIVVDDANDNDPRFRKPYYHRSIPENAKAGTTIVTLVADDADKNRTITYSLQDRLNVTSLLLLDAETGEVVVQDRIDRESQEWINTTVVATDSGLPPRSSAVGLFIQVLDENDNAPQFINPPSKVVVREDAPPGTTILTISATDPDDKDYGAITYLLDPKSSQGMFKIDPETGELMVAQGLNREVVSQYNLIIEAWDNYRYGSVTGDSRNVFTQIVVDVADINDEVPVFEPRSGCTMITEFHAAGDTITIVRATDADDPEGDNGKIRFNITSGNEENLFEIQPVDLHSARIVSRAPLVGLYDNYTLMVAARDLGSPPNEVLAQVDICVTDYNDHPPRFVSPDSNLTIRVPENATVGSLVIQVRAVDDDQGQNGAVGYRILKETSATQRTFGIDAVTGAITLLSPLDREKQKLYELRVEAFDRGSPTALKSDLDLTVYVRNMNDNAPQFAQDELTANFTENSDPGLESLVIPDTIDEDDLDLEDEVGTSVCYFIVGGDVLNTFILGKTTHVLKILKPLDREEASQHVLWVRASEDCVNEPALVTSFNPKDNTLLQVVVNVNDVNDNMPKFSREVYTGGISTESVFGLQVLELMAVDPDYGENAVLSFSMQGTVLATVSEGLDKLKQEPFLVDAKTGAVRLNFDPQRGMKGYFDFKVSVSDSSGAGDQARVFIYLLREDQRVRFVLRLAPDEIRPRLDYLRDYLSNVTEAIVNVDEYRVHETQDGGVDQTKTDLYLHFVNPADNSVLDVPQVLATIDKNVHRLDYLFKEMNVLDTSQAHLLGVAGMGLSSDDNLLMVWLVGVVAFLALLLVVTLSLCVAQRAHYARQLKAATATAFGSNESVLNRNPTVPNTNLHSVEGSNPIWMNGGFDNEWYKEEESLRYQAFVQQSESHDSLDENAVDSSLSPPPDRTAPYPRHSELTLPSSRENSNSTVASSARLTIRERAPAPSAVDSHHYDTYRSNLHHTFKKLANPLIDKKLETTEL